MPVHLACRVCDTRLPAPFLDLGPMALANAFLSSPEEFANEPAYPLAVTACTRCGLAQLTYVVPAEQLYDRYVYVSSTSEAVRRYAQELAGRLVDRYHLGPARLVAELGSNDGLVLQALQQRGARVVGVEPARDIAALARERGVPTANEFFTASSAAALAAEHGPARVILGRHVFAHIDDWHDCLSGVDAWLAPDGALLLEVPYLGALIDQVAFDTIYHEHLSYVAVQPLAELCGRHGFRLVDAEPVALHGGSLLLTMRRVAEGVLPSPRLEALLAEERRQGLTRPETLAAFARSVRRWKQEFEACVERLAGSGATLAGYGAAAKANTLLNFCPAVAARLACLLDRSPRKHGLYTPGTHLPVVSPEGWEAGGISHLMILAWNFKEEILRQMEPFAKQGGRFVIPIPQPEVV